MQVILKQATPLEILVSAIRICKGGVKHPETENNNLHQTDKLLIEKIIKSKHESTLEHIVYTFHIKDISRACLQELVRHRIASYSVKSTRFTLKKDLKDEPNFILKPLNEMMLHPTAKDRATKYIKYVNDDDTFLSSIIQLQILKTAINSELPNDVVKYLIPESFLTELYMTVNARSLRNFFTLRSPQEAHFEIRELAQNIYDALPIEHKFMYDDIF